MLWMSQSFISPVTLQVSWPSGPPPWSSSLDLDLLHQWLWPPSLPAATPGVGVHLGGAQASFPTARRPRRTRLHQTWWSAQPDAPSERWTPCRDLPERLTAAGSCEHLLLRQWLENHHITSWKLKWCFLTFHSRAAQCCGRAAADLWPASWWRTSSCLRPAWGWHILWCSLSLLQERRTQQVSSQKPLSVRQYMTFMISLQSY